MVVNPIRGTVDVLGLPDIYTLHKNIGLCRTSQQTHTSRVQRWHVQERTIRRGFLWRDTELCIQGVCREAKRKIMQAVCRDGRCQYGEPGASSYAAVKRKTILIQIGLLQAICHDGELSAIVESPMLRAVKRSIVLSHLILLGLFAGEASAKVDSQELDVVWHQIVLLVPSELILDPFVVQVRTMQI